MTGREWTEVEDVWNAPQSGRHGRWSCVKAVGQRIRGHRAFMECRMCGSSKVVERFVTLLAEATGGRYKRGAQERQSGQQLALYTGGGETSAEEGGRQRSRKGQKGWIKGEHHAIGAFEVWCWYSIVIWIMRWSVYM